MTPQPAPADAAALAAALDDARALIAETNSPEGWASLDESFAAIEGAGGDIGPGNRAFVALRQVLAALPVHPPAPPDLTLCHDCTHRDAGLAVHFVADPTNHHNAAKCPYCTPAAPPAPLPLDVPLNNLIDAMAATVRWSRSDAETDLRPVIEAARHARLATPEPTEDGQP